MSQLAPCREDFNISYKGNANTLPLRNWDEANLPEPLAMVSSDVWGRGGAMHTRVLQSLLWLCCEPCLLLQRSWQLRSVW